MNNFLSILGAVNDFLPKYSFLTAFIVSFIGGEPAVGILSAISAKGNIPLWEIAIAAYTSALLAETCWYYVGNKSLLFLIDKFLYIRKLHTKINSVVDNADLDKPFVLLLFARFISGLTIPAIIYLGSRVKFRVFIKNCIIVNLIWTSFIVGIGWALGKGLISAYESDHIFIFSSVIFIILFLLYIGKKRIGKFILRKQNS